MAIKTGMAIKKKKKKNICKIEETGGRGGI
jgi:hypothetical protein